MKSQNGEKKKLNTCKSRKKNEDVKERCNTFNSEGKYYKNQPR